MKFHEENTAIKEVTKITITKIRIVITVRRIGTKTSRVPIRRKMIRKNPMTKCLPYVNKRHKILLSCRI